MSNNLQERREAALVATRALVQAYADTFAALGFVADGEVFVSEEIDNLLRFGDVRIILSHDGEKTVVYLRTPNTIQLLSRYAEETHSEAALFALVGILAKIWTGLDAFFATRSAAMDRALRG